jgi:hypothetical protein
MDAVERIPTETAKQTDALENIEKQLSASADSDAQMSETFNKFHKTMSSMDSNIVGQKDSILQMSKTFAASDRYLKYIMARDKKRMFWLFIGSLSVCLTVLVALVVIIIALFR